MCNCINVEIGSYGNQVTVDPIPQNMLEYKRKDGGHPTAICLDSCVAKEVQQLWEMGITTTGCCCGHNILEGYIGVIDEDIPKMKALGYHVQYNTCRPFDEDSFIPKSIISACTHPTKEKVILFESSVAGSSPKEFYACHSCGRFWQVS